VNKDRKTLTETHGADWRGFTPQFDHVIRGLDGYMNEATFDPRSRSLHPDEIARRMSQPRQLDEAERTEVLTAREAVWRKSMSWITRFF
jgi:hypothetical protein